MSAFSTQGLAAILSGPARRAVQDVEQVLGVKAGSAEQPVPEPRKEGADGEEVLARSSPVRTSAGVIKGVRAVALTSAPRQQAKVSAEGAAGVAGAHGPSQVQAARREGPAVTRGLRPAAEPPRAPEASAVAETVPRLVLRRDRQGIASPKAPAPSAPPVARPESARSEAPRGLESGHGEGRAPSMGGAPSPVERAEAPGIPIRPATSREVGTVPVAARAQIEASSEEGALAPAPLTVRPPGVSAPVSSEPPRLTGEPATPPALPRLTLHRAPVDRAQSRPIAAVAATPSFQPLTPEPAQPPRITPPAVSEARESRQPPSIPSARVDGIAPRAESVQGIPLMPRGPQGMTRGTPQPGGFELVGSAPSFVPELSTPLAPPVAWAAPPAAPLMSAFAPAPESQLQSGTSPASAASSLDREQLEELLVDILQAAARGEGVEV